MQHMAFGSSPLHSGSNSRASVSHHDSPQQQDTGQQASSERWAQVEEAPEYHQAMHTGIYFNHLVTS